MRLKLVPHTQVEAMAQLLVAQGRKLRELEIRLQKEAQEKANLALDFQNLLDQLSIINTHVGTISHSQEHAVVCG